MRSGVSGLLRPFQSFFATETAGGVALLAVTVIALGWANSPWAPLYFSIFSEPVRHWINDGLMAVFFFVVGLEIKREVLVGELSTLKGAALPLVAALGGMIVPALIYVALVIGLGSRESLGGWAVPMATDIAFALGVLALLGNRAPVALKVFLTALAIADDLGAVIVIATVFATGISPIALAIAAVLTVALIVINLMGVRRGPAYILLGIAVWAAVYKSGVHATVAGVLVAMTIPARDRNKEPDRSQLLWRMEHALHPWMSFAIMPIFALANAGVRLGAAAFGEATSHPATIAVFFGLWIGKQLGVFSFAWLAIKLGLASLPTGANWRQVYGVSCLCGIGFTMSLFIAGLAFDSPAMLQSAKIGILAGSMVSAVSGLIVLATAPARGR